MRTLAILASALAGVASATPAGARRYLSGPGVALLDVLPPAPVAGSAADAADRAAFRATRAEEGSPRWRQAIGDVDEKIPAMLADFAPAAGRELSVRDTPVLAGDGDLPMVVGVRGRARSARSGTRCPGCRRRRCHRWLRRHGSRADGYGRTRCGRGSSPGSAATRSRCAIPAASGGG